MNEKRTILIVEDSPTLARTCQMHLEPLGHHVLVAPDGQSAWGVLDAQPVDCVLLDLKLPDMDGMTILEKLRQRPVPPAVVIVTANASLATAVQAVRSGAADYLVKPFAPSRLTTTVEIALGSAALRREVETLRRTIEPAGFQDFVGRSPAMQAVYRVLEAAAPSTASVFITGESGTGKELAAEALHRLSPRKARPLIVLNCGAIPRDLMESTMFGHLRGAFTGATTDREGAAAAADGGTLFLDELGEMDAGLQTKLLRFIQTGTYQRVGDPAVRRADIRFVAATNRDPARAIRDGLLREDLYYRLNVVPLRMPPLRDRGEDIVLIARRFLEQFSIADNKKFVAFAPEVEARLLAFSWPGNVRQLQNVVRNAVVLHNGETLTLEMLPPLVEHSTETIDARPAQFGVNTDGFSPSLSPRSARSGDQASVPERAAAGEPGALLVPISSEADIAPLADAERRYIQRTIDLCGGNLQLAARRLGISPSTIYRKKETWARP
ncbi:MAG: sigma-54-dependent Fis family transcriptional regulator [Proteobacteria bacterium]|nr:sigma-54-dependent Fis family transcriptional regulator [Pseudomonadota bacterium]